MAILSTDHRWNTEKGAKRGLFSPVRAKWPLLRYLDGVLGPSYFKELYCLILFLSWARA